MSVRITCINKDQGNHENPHMAIQNLGWVDEQSRQTGKSTRLEMYDFIVNQRGQAYVTDTRGIQAYLEGKTSRNGTRFVQTIPDRVHDNNLLYLPECP